jgi:crossover junction endodeoxyribonuclease RuvC
MSVKVVGVDPGMAATGIGIVTGSAHNVTAYAFGTVSTSSSATPGFRLERIYSRLCILIKDEKPDLIVIEDVFSLDKYPQSGISLGKVCGVILLAAQQAGIDVRPIAVREAKQVLTGNGNASKEQLERAVRHSLNCADPIRPYHASDALGLALIGLFRYAGHQWDRKAGLSKEKRTE